MRARHANEFEFDGVRLPKYINNGERHLIALCIHLILRRQYMILCNGEGRHRSVLHLADDANDFRLISDVFNDLGLFSGDESWRFGRMD